MHAVPFNHSKTTRSSAIADDADRRTRYAPCFSWQSQHLSFVKVCQSVKFEVHNVIRNMLNFKMGSRHVIYTPPLLGGYLPSVAALANSEQVSGAGAENEAERARKSIEQSGLWLYFAKLKYQFIVFIRYFFLRYLEYRLRYRYFEIPRYSVSV